MLHLDVRGENDDRGLGNFFANYPSGVEPFRCVARRHPDVNDRELGPMFADERDQLRGVAALTDDLEPSALEQARQTFAKEDFVVRQRHPRPALSHAANYRLA
jgi:hypothetical protein